MVLGLQILFLVSGFWFKPLLNPPRGGGLEGLDGFEVRIQKIYFLVASWFLVLSRRYPAPGIRHLFEHKNKKSPDVNHQETSYK